MHTTTTGGLPAARVHTAWGAVVIMAAMSFILSTAEFLPPSLLPAMASSLGITEGQAGQAVTVTAFAGLVFAPLIGTLFPRLDRRALLIGLAVSAALSNAVVAITGDLVVLLLARLLLGAAIGGFWAMSLAVAARVSAPERIGRAMTFVNMGATLATVAGVPAGIWLGSLVEWRTVFAGIAVITLVVALALRLLLPDVAPDETTGFRALGRTLRVPGLAWGLAGHTMTMLATFGAFTYIRPALALTPGIEDGGAALFVALYGVGSVIGGLAVGALVDRHLTALRLSQPFVLAIAIAALVLCAGQPWLIGIAVLLWGGVFGGWLIIVSTWVGRVAPALREAGGGLVVAGYQLAIALGAGVGGLLVDQAGIRVALVVAAAAAAIGGVLFATARMPDRG